MKSRLKGYRAYLAGNMEYTGDSGVSWRKTITPELQRLGLKVMDPMDRPVRMSFAESGTEELAKLKKFRKDGDYDSLVEYAAEIVHQDLRMVDKADLLIVSIDPTIPTVGTIDEFVNACEERKPIFLFCKGGLSQIPLWLWGRMGKNYKKIACNDMDDVLKRLNAIAYKPWKKANKYIDHRKWVFFDED